MGGRVTVSAAQRDGAGGDERAPTVTGVVIVVVRRPSRSGAPRAWVRAIVSAADSALDIAVLASVTVDSRVTVSSGVTVSSPERHTSALLISLAPAAPAPLGVTIMTVLITACVVVTLAVAVVKAIVALVLAVELAAASVDERDAVVAVVLAAAEEGVLRDELYRVQEHGPQEEHEDKLGARVPVERAADSLRGNREPVREDNEQRAAEEARRDHADKDPQQQLLDEQRHDGRPQQPARDWVEELPVVAAVAAAARKHARHEPQQEVGEEDAQGDVDHEDEDVPRAWRHVDGAAGAGAGREGAVAARGVDRKEQRDEVRSDLGRER